MKSSKISIHNEILLGIVKSVDLQGQSVFSIFEMGKTFADVARAAGVSPGTVSRIVSRKAVVNPETEARVRAAAARLGVKLEKAGAPTILAFVLANRDLLHPFQARILTGAEAQCGLQGCELLFLSFRYPTDARPSELHLPRILSRRDVVSGVILGGTNSANLLEALQSRGIPFSVLGNNVVGQWSPENFDVVFADDIQGAFEMTRCLQNLGHRDIWCISNPHLPWFARSVSGYCRAMLQAGLKPRICELNSDLRNLGYLAAKSILSGAEKVTAIFASTDQVAHGVYDAIRAHGLRVPEDISVVGMNDTEGRILHPALSSVQCFPEEIGRHLAEFAARRVSDPTLPPQNLSIATQIISRESCAPPAAAAAANA